MSIIPVIFVTTYYSFDKIGLFSACSLGSFFAIILAHTNVIGEDMPGICT